MGAVSARSAVLKLLARFPKTSADATIRSMNAVITKAALQKTTGERVREYRNKRGLTQVELAKLVGIHEITVNRIERGIQLPDWATICNLADVLGVTSDKLRKS